MSEPTLRSARVALISLEPWDDVWRRNQHLASELVGLGLVGNLLFVEPAAKGWPRRRRSVAPGLDVLTPPKLIPRRLGGDAVTGLLLRAFSLRGIDRVWINAALWGVHSLSSGVPTVYDITDDWRDFPQPARERARLTKAEARLATRAKTVVCSGVLAKRWRDRYHVEAIVIPNAVDASAWHTVEAIRYEGAAPQVGYVGTLHAERLDVEILTRLAEDPRIGSVHLVGPNNLDGETMQRLQHSGVLVHEPVSAPKVPGVMTGFDVLICPHVITPFTLSLDAIKAYEYAASGRPVVATATSGFQDAQGVVVSTDTSFPEAVVQAIGAHQAAVRPTVPMWSERARDFAAVLA